MRKIILLLALILVLVPSSTYAQTTSPVASQASPPASVNLILGRTLNNLSTRLKAGVFRAEKISSRILARLTKMQANAAFLSRQKNIAVSLEQVKLDLVQLELASQMLASSSSLKKDYPVFKNQVLLLTKNLTDIYKMELNLVSDMKQIASITAVPTASVVPTR